VEDDKALAQRTSSVLIIPVRVRGITTGFATLFFSLSFILFNKRIFKFANYGLIVEITNRITTYISRNIAYIL